IAAALGPSLGMATLRPDFKLSPRTVVRRGALHAEVTCWLHFSSEEIAATRDIFRLAELPEKVLDAPEIKLTWTYPDPRKPSGFVSSGLFLPGLQSNIVIKTFSSATSTQVQVPSEYGFSQSDPEAGLALLHGRFVVAQLLATGRADWSWFRKVGGVFTFDQERTGLGRTISRQVWNIIHGTAEAARDNEELRTTDPRTILVDLALQSLVPSIGLRGQLPEEF